MISKTTMSLRASTTPTPVHGGLVTPGPGSPPTGLGYDTGFDPQAKNFNRLPPPSLPKSSNSYRSDVFIIILLQEL